MCFLRGAHTYMYSSVVYLLMVRLDGGQWSCVVHVFVNIGYYCPHVLSIVSHDHATLVWMCIPVVVCAAGREQPVQWHVPAARERRQPQAAAAAGGAEADDTAAHRAAEARHRAGRYVYVHVHVQLLAHAYACHLMRSTSTCLCSRCSRHEAITTV